MYNPGNLENNDANQDGVQSRNSESFVGRNMNLSSNNANSPQSDSASKTSTTAVLRRWRRPEAQDNSSKNVSTKGSSNDPENSGVKRPTSTINQSKEMNPHNCYPNNTDNSNGSAPQNDYAMFVSPASLSPIVPQSTARPYDTNTYIPRVPSETGAYSRTSPVVATTNKLTPEVKSSDTTVRHPVGGNNQSPYYHHHQQQQQHHHHENAVQHFRGAGYPIQNTPPLVPTSTQSPIYALSNQKRDYGYQNYASKSPQEQRTTREHSVLTHSYSTGGGTNLDTSRVGSQGICDDSKINGYRQDSRVISQGYHMQNVAERRVTPPKTKSPTTYRNFPNSSTLMDSRIAQNYVNPTGRIQAAEYMAQNYYLNKSSCIVQEARVQNQIHSSENPILDARYQQSYNHNYIMPKTAVINSQDPKHYRNVITSSKKHVAPFPILEQRLNTAENYSSEYLAQSNSQLKYGHQVILPRSSPTSRITRESTASMHPNCIPHNGNQKLPQEMMIPSNYALQSKYYQQNPNQDWRLIKDYEQNAHLNQMNQMHARLPHSSTNRTPEVPRDVPYVEQNQRLIQKSRMFYSEPGSVEYLQYTGKASIPIAQKSPKVISYNVSDQRIPEQIQNDYLNLTRTASNAVRPNDYPRNPVIQTANVPEVPYIVHQPYRNDVSNEQHNYQMLQNSRHPSYAINYSNRQVKVNEIPPRNISPRRTFQENMPYFVISPPHAGLSNTSPSPLCNTEHSQHNYPGYYSRDSNYPGVGVAVKPTIPQYPVDPIKYQNVPFNRNIPQPRHPYGYQEQYFQARTLEPNQIPGNMYSPQHNPDLSEQTAQARMYEGEYRNDDTINSSYNEFERNRRKEEIGKSLKEFLESWEDDEDIVSNLPDLVLNIPADRQKNNSVSSSESSENNVVGKTIPTKENPQAEPLYVLDARSISSDALSQYLPYCKVYQSLPENIRGFYPNSVSSEDAPVLSQQATSKSTDTKTKNDDILDTNINNSLSPHDLSVNRKTVKEDNVQAEVLNLSTNRNKENDEFMTEEYSSASDDASVPENVSCEVIKSPVTIQNKIDENTNQIDKCETSNIFENNCARTEHSKNQSEPESVQIEEKKELLETTIEKPVTASVIVQNMFLSNKTDNSDEKTEIQSSEKHSTNKSSEESKNEPIINQNDTTTNESLENISTPTSRDLEKKRPSVDSIESADSIRTSLIESEIKEIDFEKNNLDDSQFDFDTALLSTESKDSNEESKIDIDPDKNSLVKDNGLDLSLETMLLSPEQMETNFEERIPKISTSSTDESSLKNIVDEINNSKNTTSENINVSSGIPLNENESFDKTETIIATDVTENIDESNIFENFASNPEEHADKLNCNLEIKKLDIEMFHTEYMNDKTNSLLNSPASLETNIDETTNKFVQESSSPVEVNQKHDIEIEGNVCEIIKVDPTEIPKKETIVIPAEEETVCLETQVDNGSKSPFADVETLEHADNSKEAVDEENIKLAESITTIEIIKDEKKESIDSTVISEIILTVNSCNEHPDVNSQIDIDSEKSFENYLENNGEIKEDIIEGNEFFEEKNEIGKISESSFEENIENTTENLVIENNENFSTPETKTSEDNHCIDDISFEDTENNEHSIIEIKSSSRDNNTLEDHSFENTESKEEISTVHNKEILDNNVSQVALNENSIEINEANKDRLQETMVANENQSAVNDINETFSEEINEKSSEEINENSLEEITNGTNDEENINIEHKKCQNLPYSHLAETTIHLPSSPKQENEIVIDEDLNKNNMSKNAEESQVDEIEFCKVEYKNLNISKNEDIIANVETVKKAEIFEIITCIKHETNLEIFDEDTMPSSENIKEDNAFDSNEITKINSEIKTENATITIEEAEMNVKLNLPSENPVDYQNKKCEDTKKLDETIETIFDHTSCDSEEYQHLIKLEDEEIANEDLAEKQINISVNSNIMSDTLSLNTNEKKSTEYDTNSKNKASSSVLIKIEEVDTPLETPKDNSEVPNDIVQALADKPTIEESEIEQKEGNKKEIGELTKSSLELFDDTAKANVILNEEIIVEQLLSNDNITFIEEISNENSEKIAKKVIVSEDSNCVLVYSDDDNIVILQSDPNECELVHSDIPIEESSYISTENPIERANNVKEKMINVDLEKDEFIPEKNIEEKIIGNDVIICENGIDDDWIQNEEIVETKTEAQELKETEKLKAEALKTKKLLMKKKKKRVERSRKRKLLSIINITNIFLEEERKAYTISETLVNENTKSNSPFKEKITEDKQLFINPENPSSSSEDNSSMTHELLNLKPRIKRRFSCVDTSSPKIDFVAPKRRYSNMEFIRNNFKKPLINLDEISNNITKVIESMNKQETLQYNSFDNSKCRNNSNLNTKKVNASNDNYVQDDINLEKNNCQTLLTENKDILIKPDAKGTNEFTDSFVKSTDNLLKPIIKTTSISNNLNEDNKLIHSDQKNVQEEKIVNTVSDAVVKNGNINVKLENLNTNEENLRPKLDNKNKCAFEQNFVNISIKPPVKETKAIYRDLNYEKLPSFQNYTDDLKKKINTENVTNKEEIKSGFSLVPKISSCIDSVIGIQNKTDDIITPLQNTLSVPNKQRNMDPRIERAKETPIADIVSPTLVKNKIPKTFGLTEYTKHYLKMKTGQSIVPQIQFGENGVKRLDPRLTVKPKKSTEIIETASTENPKQKISNMNVKLKSNNEKKVKINLQDYRNRKLSLSESENQKTNENPKEELFDNSRTSSEDVNEEHGKNETDYSAKSDATNGLTNNEQCRFYIRDKCGEKSTEFNPLEKTVIKPKKILEKPPKDSFGISKETTNKQPVNTTYSTNKDSKNLSNNKTNKTLKSNLDFKTQKPKKRRKRFRNLDGSDEDDEVVTKQQNVIRENQNGYSISNEDVSSSKLDEDSQHSSTVSKCSGDSNCLCCVDLNSNNGDTTSITTENNCGLKCHIKLNSLDKKIRNYEINKNASGNSNLKLTLKPVKKKPKPAFAEVLNSIDSVVENEVTTTKRKPHKLGLKKCDSGKKSTMWTIKNKVPKVIIKRNASGYCAVFRDVSSNPIWQPKIRLKRQKYIETLVLSNQVKISKKIPS